MSKPNILKQEKDSCIPKEYAEPQIEIICLEIKDILTESNGSENEPPNSNGGNWGDWIPL